MVKDLTGYYYSMLIKALNYLEFTYDRVRVLPTKPSDLSPEQLERWDSMATRFARASDLFLSKYIKAAVKRDDPAFDGAFRDYLGCAHKLGLVDDTETWLVIRNLRNVAVHEYSEGDLEKILISFVKLTPLVLDLRQRLANATDRI